jgi:selenocysteine lyase/cysteine desulfurase
MGQISHEGVMRVPDESQPRKRGGAAERKSSNAANAATAKSKRAAPSPRANGAAANGAQQPRARTASPKATAARATTAEPQLDLLRYRDEFPILARKTYLNSCSLGALSRRSMDAMERFQEYWNEFGAQAWYRIWMGELDALRGKFARLIGAQPHEIALAPNVSSALSEITSALDLGDRRKVVLNDMDFPTLAYQWLAKERTGTQVAFAHSEDRMTLPAEAYTPLVDERTGFVATSRVFYLSGYIQDIAVGG